MPQDKSEFESTNISEKWNENIFENIRNLEKMDRYAREGCDSIMEFAQLLNNPNYNIIIKEVQYKNAKMMLSEIQLLLTDIRIIIDDEFYNKIKKLTGNLQKYINKRNLFIVESYDTTKGRIIGMELTPLFYSLLEKLCKLRGDIIFEISSTLYVKKEVKSQEILR